MTRKYRGLGRGLNLFFVQNIGSRNVLTTLSSIFSPYERDTWLYVDQNKLNIFYLDITLFDLVSLQVKAIECGQISTDFWAKSSK